MTMASSLPVPPDVLAARVGTPEGQDPVAFYRGEGARLRTVIEAMLPSDWTWEGKQVLDFGCGSARVLRQFEQEAESASFVGCDIDAASIAWNEANLVPPFRFFQCDVTPPLPLDSSSVHLIWAMSVFTHIAESWSEWLVEMHRILGPDGILLVSYLGEGMWQPLVGEAYSEDAIGMTVLNHWHGPEAWVFHSEWWLREHWGRAFEFLGVTPPARSLNGALPIQHTYAALRKRAVEISPEELEAIDLNEPRELTGLQTSLRLTQRDLATTAAEQREEGRRDARDYYENSHSWRVTAPLRRAGLFGRALVGRGREATRR